MILLLIFQDGGKTFPYVALRLQRTSFQANTRRSWIGRVVLYCVCRFLLSDFCSGEFSVLFYLPFVSDGGFKCRLLNVVNAWSYFLDIILCVFFFVKALKTLEDEYCNARRHETFKPYACTAFCLFCGVK